MRYKSLLFLVITVLAFTSCVSTKKTTYLQSNSSEIDSIIKIQRIKKPYRIQVGDLLSIRVKALDQELIGMFNPVSEGQLNATTEERVYFEGFTVDDHGNIRFPTLGEVSVLGYTVEEVRKKIEKELLEKYFKEQANIFVTVKMAGIRYTTLGEIGTGSQVIYKEDVSIIEAIANAGGIGNYGDMTNVKVIRQYPHGEEIHSIDLTSIDATKSPYYYIQPNDIIIVDPLPQKALGLGTTGLGVVRTVASFIAIVTSVILLVTR